jgi:esterase/lipase
VVRAPNGTVQDTQEFWTLGKTMCDPAKITVPTLVVLGEWDCDTPPYMAQALFPLLVNSPDKRLVLLAEGTHHMMLEKNRTELFKTVQAFLDESAA